MGFRRGLVKKKITDSGGGGGSYIDTTGLKYTFSFRQLTPDSTLCLKQFSADYSTSQNVGFVDGYVDTASILSFSNGALTRFEWYDQLTGNLRYTRNGTMPLPVLTDATGVLNIINGKIATHSPPFRLAILNANVTADGNWPASSHCFQVGKTDVDYTGTSTTFMLNATSNGKFMGSMSNEASLTYSGMTAHTYWKNRAQIAPLSRVNVRNNLATGVLNQISIKNIPSSEFANVGMVKGYQLSATTFNPLHHSYEEIWGNATIMTSEQVTALETNQEEYYGITEPEPEPEAEYPLTLTKYQTSVETPSMIFPSIYKSSDYPEITTTKAYFMLYSSDHGSLAGAACYWGEMDNVNGAGFIERGVVAQYGNQSETPVLMRRPVADGGYGIYLFLHGLYPDNRQETELYTTPGGAALHLCSFTFRGYPFLETGNTHTGYAKIYQLGVNSYLAHHIVHAQLNYAEWGYSTSTDLENWTRVNSNATQTPAGIPSGFSIGWRTRIFPFEKNGTDYAVVQYHDPNDTTIIKLGVCEVDANYIPTVFIKHILDLQAYDSIPFIESDTLHFFVYLDGGDGVTNGDYVKSPNAYLCRVNMTNAIIP